MLVDTGSNVSFVDSAYCASQQSCNAIYVEHGGVPTSYSQQGVAVIRGKQNRQNIAYRAFAADMSNNAYKLLLSANAATQLGILRHSAVHRDTPTNELPELPVDESV